MTNKDPHMIYKICSAVEWAGALNSGRYEGSEDDLRDGFMHFSTADQLAGTAQKHFSGEDDLVLVSVLVSSLGEGLKWEKSRGGDLFPHYYGSLDIAKVYTVQPLVLGDDGVHIFPGELV